MTEPREEEVSIRQLQLEASRFAPRFDPELWRCPVCSLGATHIVPLSDVWWPLCGFCRTRAASPIVGRFQPWGDEGLDDYGERLLAIAFSDVIPNSHCNGGSMSTTGHTDNGQQQHRRSLRLLSGQEFQVDSRNPFWNSSLLALYEQEQSDRLSREASAKARAVEQTEADRDIAKEGDARLVAEGDEGRQRREPLARFFELNPQFTFNIGQQRVPALECARRVRAGADFSTYFRAQTTGEWFRK